MMNNEYYGELSLIGLNGSEKFVKRVDEYLCQWRKNERDTYIVNADLPRFGTGEAKGIIKQSLRGHDLFIYADCFNYGVKYKMYGIETCMSPDDHYQDLKRIICANETKARRITVIMPMLYEGRQHKRNGRESLDCALALQELVNLGVSDIITFDAHDARVQNAIPNSGFDNVRTTYQMLKALTKKYPDIRFDPEKVMIITPDEGGMSRAIYYSSVLGIELGMFYKRRNYSIIVDGRNPIEAHEYLGRSVKDKDVIIVDDMISSGESILDIASELKQRGAKRIFVFATFGLFCNGCDKFDKAFEDEIFTQIFTTNLNYRSNDVINKPWYTEVSLCKYVSYLVDTINRDHTISELLDPVKRIHNLVERVNKGEASMQYGAAQEQADADTRQVK